MAYFLFKYEVTLDLRSISMPGFNINQYLGGDNSNAPSHTQETRRKHRWVFSTLGLGAGQWRPNELLMLKTASRPTFKLTPVDMHHNQEQVYFAGKQEWETVSMSWYDGEQNPNISQRLYDWLSSVVQLAGGNMPVSTPSFYKKDANLSMINGVGTPTETWNMVGTWPLDLKWSDLDYGASDIMMCEATMRYDRAVKIL
jgi:hypothetical protein